MCSFLKKEKKGFTLVELLIAMAIALVVIAAVSSTFIFQQKTFNVQEQITEMQQGARAAIDMLTNEIMLAGYDPIGAGIVGVSYSASQLQIRADLNGNGNTSDSHENIIYTFDSTNNQIDRKP